MISDRHTRVMNNFPKVEYPGPDFLKDIHIIRNLIFAIQQVTIMEILLNLKSVVGRKCYTVFEALIPPILLLFSNC